MSIAAAGALPLAFGVLTALGMVLAGRARPERVHPLLVSGTALLGAGLVAAAPADEPSRGRVPASPSRRSARASSPRSASPYFARFVPEGEAGRYSGVFFAGRAVAAAAALPLAGLAVELSGSYRAVLWLGSVALVALVPLVLRSAARRAGSTPCAGEPAATARSGGRRDSGVRVRPRGRGGARDPRHVDEVVLVDDGAPLEVARSLDRFATDDRVRVLALGANGGKGSAVAAGVDLLLPDPSRRRRSWCWIPTGSTIPTACPPSSTPAGRPTS